MKQGWICITWLFRGIYFICLLASLICAKIRCCSFQICVCRAIIECLKKLKASPEKHFSQCCCLPLERQGPTLWSSITLLDPHGHPGRSSNRCSVHLHLWSKCFIGQAGQLRHVILQFKIMKTDGGRSHPLRISDPPSFLFSSAVHRWVKAVAGGSPRPRDLYVGCPWARTSVLTFLLSGIVPDIS